LATKNKKHFTRLVIDEGISKAQYDEFDKFMKTRKLVCDEFLFIKDDYPGIPDEVIFKKLTTEETLLLTTDRPFHNSLLNHGRRSFYIDDKFHICGRKLEGIRPSEIDNLVKVELKEDYRPQVSELRKRIMPLSEKAQKKLRTKRRRIRNHFGTIDNIRDIAATLSINGDILGIKLTASSRSGNLKAMTASESYIRLNGQDTQLETPFCQLLVLLLQLLLNELTILVFFDERVLKEPQSGSFINELRSEFSQLEFTPVDKGIHLDRMRQKLRDLRVKPSNEIVDSLF
jgi:hypothetical protein